MKGQAKNTERKEENRGNLRPNKFMEKKKTKSNQATFHDVEFANEPSGLVSQAIQKMYSQSGPEKKVRSQSQNHESTHK